MEGNTLSMAETDLVINEGQTISGKKSMREQLTIRKIVFIQNSIKKQSFLVKRTLPAYYHFTRNFTERSR
jgi:hypothetical protein